MLDAVEHFRVRLRQLPVRRLLSLLEIEVVGPQPMLAAVTTRHLIQMVEEELAWRQRVAKDLTAA